MSSIGRYAKAGNQDAPDNSQADSTSNEGEDAGDDAQQEVKEIEFLHIWPEYEEIFNKQIAEFEEENPDIKIKTTVITWDVLTQTLQTAFAGGTPPDVTVAWLDRMGGFNAIGASLDLTPYLEENGGEWANSLVPASLSLGKVGKQNMGIPFRSTATMLVYNKTLMEEHGWEEPTTLEEFEALNELAVAAGITPLIAPGNPEGFQTSSLAMTFVEHELYKSGKIQTEEYLSGYMSDVAQEYALGAERTREWLNKGYIGSDSLAIKREEAQAQFYAQDGLFLFVNNNELLSVRDSATESGFEVDFMGFPSPEGMPQISYKLGVDGFFVNNNTEYPEESVRFLQYLTSQDVQQYWADETLSVMANKNVTYSDANLSKMANILGSAESYRILFPYSQGSLLTEEHIEIANYLANPSMSSEELGALISQMKEECIEENN